MPSSAGKKQRLTKCCRSLAPSATAAWTLSRRPLAGSFGFFFFFNDTATTEIYTLSLHDALPISAATARRTDAGLPRLRAGGRRRRRSEEHTSELQSRQYLVCRLLLEKKKTR